MEKKYKVPAVEKIEAILNVVALQAPISFTAILEQTGYNKSTVFSLLKSLEAARFLMLNAEGQYELGQKIGFLGAKYFQKNDFVNVFQRVAAKACEEIHHTFQLSILNEHQIIYLSKAEAKNAIQLSTHPGSVMPASATAMGKVLLSSLDDEAICALYKEVELPRYTSKTVDQIDVLLQQVHFVRQHGYIQEIGETSEDITCIAAPIYNVDKKMIAAISISFPIAKRDQSEIIQRAVLDVSKEISHILGYLENSHNFQ